MKIKDLQQSQSSLFEQFQHILEQGRLSHAYLFTGAFGSFEMAQILSQSLFCENKQGVWPCQSCRSCRLIAEEDFSDVTVVRPFNNIIKTDRVRELVRNFSQSGLEGSRQVFIICGADRMHVNAANSLLKVIEEPQSEIYIFLLTADEQLILPTIRSRTQVYHFLKNTAALQHSLEQDGLIKSRAVLIAAYSQTHNNAFFELVSECERFVKDFQTRSSQAFLQVSRLAKMADDKEKQEQVFKLLEVLFYKDIATESGRQALEKLLLARKMWQANVSFQNALEYMTLKGK